MKYEIQKEIPKDGREKLKKYSDILAHLLWYRGHKEETEVEDFLHPDYSNICDPLTLAGIEKATDRVLEAIKNVDKVCVFSDYDADGIPGAVILTQFFDKVGFDNYFVYIPHRNREGFGLNNGAIDSISEKEAVLIITIDCGIADVGPISYAKEKNIDVIVTDHHEPNSHQSEAYEVINPKRKDCSYPDKNICGAGVIFKFIQALIIRGDFNLQDGWEKWLLDMVGISTISDMVPLVGENRILAHYGLLVLHKTPRKGLQKLIYRNRLKPKDITEDDIGFTISPRINAASRMDEPEIAYRMLYTDSDTEADETVRHLDKINNERKGSVAAMVKEIKSKVDEENEGGIIVHGNPKWKPSLLGLAASNIVESYHKPTFLWGRGEGENLKGSCRSDGTVNLVEMMNAAKGSIIEFGGHEMAGGFVVSDDGIYTIKKDLEDAYTKTKHSDVDKTITVDMLLSLDQVNWSVFNEINTLAPFGIANEKPNFLFKNIEIDEVIKFGANQAHIKLIFRSPKGNIINAIKFFSGDSLIYLKLNKGDRIDLIANMEKSNFGGRLELRLRIIDLEIV